VGDENLETLANIKSREEMIGEIIGLLQSPIQRLVSALQNKAEVADAPAEAAPAEETKVEEAPAAETTEAPEAAAEGTETPAAE
jgi:large subunit ribosomal protein L10